jgi:hypothetical protein
MKGEAFMEDKDWWQITEFANEISRLLQEKFNDPKLGVHYNTVDKWFKNLETKRIHYVSRSAGEKVYAREDLHIGCFIAERRVDNKWRLGAIYDDVVNHCDIRPFPEDFKDDTSTSVDATLLQNKLTEHNNKLIAQQFAIYEQKMQLQVDRMVAEKLNETIKMLTAPVNKEEERASRISENFARMKIDIKLEEKAIIEWNKLPETERMKKVGIFRKEEDMIKRDSFIRDYKKNNMERVFAEEYSLQ